MSDIWIGASVLILIAIAFIFIPYVFVMRRGDLVREKANVDIYKNQLHDLEQEKAYGRINDADYESLVAEVKRNLLLDTEQQKNTTNHEGGKWLMPVMAVVLVFSSVLLYKQLGAENEVEIASALKRSFQAGFEKEDAVELLERLNVQIEETPKDVEVWYLIGRLNFDMGNFNQAVVGFTGVLQHLAPEATQDKAVALAQLAQAQFFANGRKLDKATESLLQDALAINPRDNTSLGLLGVAAYEAENYLAAVGYWNRLLKLMDPRNPNTSAIKNGIEKAKSLLTPKQLAQLEKEMADSIKARISITVDVADNLKAKLPKNADLFVLAKAKSGPPMPLAVQRLTVDTWPVTVMLDDSMAMMDSLRLSEFDQIVITARISKSGVGNAKAGDLEGHSDAVSSGTAKLSVKITDELN